MSISVFVYSCVRACPHALFFRQDLNMKMQKLFFTVSGDFFQRILLGNYMGEDYLECIWMHKSCFGEGLKWWRPIHLVNWFILFSTSCAAFPVRYKKLSDMGCLMDSTHLCEIFIFRKFQVYLFCLGWKIDEVILTGHN